MRHWHECKKHGIAQNSCPYNHRECCPLDAHVGLIPLLQLWITVDAVLTYCSPKARLITYNNNNNNVLTQSRIYE